MIANLEFRSVGTVLTAALMLATAACENNNPTDDTRGNERIEPGEAPGTSTATGNVERD